MVAADAFAPPPAHRGATFARMAAPERSTGPAGPNERGRAHRRGEVPPEQSPWRERLFEVIFEADTPAGKAFDVLLLVVILLSVLAVCLESVPEIHAEHGVFLRTAEWVFTVLFTIEYALRLICVRRPWRYATSFFGVVDLLAILPTYLSVMPGLAGTQSLLVIRGLRLLRVFRVFKLSHFLGEAHALRMAMRGSLRKITIFVTTVLALVLIIGALMHLIEGPESGFTSIPQSMYWAIVTMTTVGYGDIAPQTVLGKFLASAVMIIGYGIIAVPTGIVTVELSRVAAQPPATGEACPACGADRLDPKARFCRMCGERLAE